MTEPAHLTAPAGQKYVVLRVGGDVECVVQDTQRQLRERLAGLPVGYPNTGHVTLRGFPRDTDFDRVIQVLDTWSIETPPLAIEIERPTQFGPPHKVLILRVKRTGELVRAYSRLAELADQAGLPAIAETGRPVEAWVFHVSLAYCKNLTDEDWARVVELVEGLTVPPAHYRAEDAELVCFDDEGEHQTVFRLGDSGRPTS